MYLHFYENVNKIGNELYIIKKKYIIWKEWENAEDNDGKRLEIYRIIDSAYFDVGWEETNKEGGREEEGEEEKVLLKDCLSFFSFSFPFTR